MPNLTIKLVNGFLVDTVMVWSDSGLCLLHWLHLVHFFSGKQKNISDVKMLFCSSMTSLWKFDAIDSGWDT